MSLCPTSVLITGANRGIGLEFVKQFLKLPTPPKCVFAACRSPDSAKDLQAIADKSDAVTIIKIDLLDLSTLPESVKVVESKLGGSGLNLLINNAGILKRDNIDTVTPEAMNEHFRVHVTGALTTVQNYLPLLKMAAKQGSGVSINTSAIINISSGMGSIGDNSSGRFYAYRAAKAGQNMVTKTLANDLKGDGIICSSLCPGWVQTDMGGKTANLTTEDSIQIMFNIMKTLQSEKGSGKFFNSHGKEMEW